MHNFKNPLLALRGECASFREQGYDRGILWFDLGTAIDIQWLLGVQIWWCQVCMQLCPNPPLVCWEWSCGHQHAGLPSCVRSVRQTQSALLCLFCFLFLLGKREYTYHLSPLETWYDPHSSGRIFDQGVPQPPPTNTLPHLPSPCHDATLFKSHQAVISTRAP